MLPSTDEAALGNLVRQFRSATDCIRELVQNSTDAGSDSVLVWTEYVPGEGHLGTIAIHVEDSGDGMDERIIDGQLTQLFSSSKEGDLTKIGKFGIGFVSVFALEPRGVLVRTGRGGEYWEVFFHEDRSFTKTSLDVPVEGTTVSLFVEGDLARYRGLAGEILDKLRHWCCHSEIPIRFEDRSREIDEHGPLDVHGALQVEGDLACVVTLGHSVVALAYSQRPTYSFYNRGLTLARSETPEQLLDDVAGRFRKVSIKLQSPYLEHTLARDGVLRDENYRKALALLVQALEQQLFPTLLASLEELARAPELTPAELHVYASRLTLLTFEPESVLAELADRPLLRTHAGARSPRALHAQALELGAVLVSPHPSRLVRVLERDGLLTLYAAEHGTLGQIGAAAKYLIQHSPGAGFASQLKRFFKAPPEADQFELTHPGALFSPLVRDERPSADELALVGAAHALLRGLGIKYDETLVCRSDAEDAAVRRLRSRAEDRPFALDLVDPRILGEEDLFFVVAQLDRPLRRAPRQPTSTATRRNWWRRMRDRFRSLAVNADHAHFRQLLALHQTEPQMAAYCLARALLLEQDLDLHLDRALLEAAHPVLCAEVVR